MSRETLSFGAYRLDLAGEQLWHGRRRVRLTPKTFRLLRHVAERPGELVTKEALFRALWPKTAVTDAALTRCVRELRRALRDDARRPRFVETVHRRGLRFLPSVASPLPRAAISRPTPPRLVGRHAELAQLQAWLDLARGGERQVVFVTGEPGIGKTTLVEALLASIESEPGLSAARGQCVDANGAGEAYLPILEALERLCHHPDGERTAALLRRHAPSWLVHLPGVIGAGERERLRRQALGASPARMLRELTAALETLTRERPLILALEDLQWADGPTLALLAAVARRPEPARLLVLATYRPTDVRPGEHTLPTLKPELALHGQCRELALASLGEAAIADYLAVRFVGHRFPPALARDLHARTEGNPLFLVTLVDHLVGRGDIIPAGDGWLLSASREGTPPEIPEHIREVIESQRARLTASEQRLADVASVVGAELSVAALAAGLEREPATVDVECAALARRGLFLRPTGTTEWPDGTLATRYAFAHALHREVLYEALPAAERIRLHRLIGERLERGFGERGPEIATTLAVHFERGRDADRAVAYLTHAGENAVARGALREATRHLGRALTLLDGLADPAERADRELAIRTVLGPTLIAAEGYTAPAVAECYARARVLCAADGAPFRLFPALIGSRSYALVRGDLASARQLEERARAVAERAENPILLALADLALGTTSFYRGDLATARAELARAAALRDFREVYLGAIPHYEVDPIVPCFSYMALVVWMQGHDDEALAHAREAIRLAEEPLHPLTLAFARFSAACLYQLRDEPTAALAEAEATLELAEAHGLPNFTSFATILRGWARAALGEVDAGLDELRRGLTSYRAAGAELAATHFLALLAQAAARAGRMEEARASLDAADALAARTDERYYAAELLRLRGELDPSADAAACFERARALAVQQTARALERRASASLARLRQRTGAV